MTIDLACPGCGKSYTLPESQRGKRARCKRCGQEFRIDAPAPEPELAIPEPPKLAYLEPSITLAKPPPPPVYAPPPPPSLRSPTEVVLPRRAPAPQAVLPDSIPVECPHCAFRYDVDASLGGKRARCKSCKEVFRLPEAAAVVPTPAAPIAPLATFQTSIPPAWGVEAPEAVRPPLWTIPPGGLGPLKVGLVAVGGCLVVVLIGVVIRAMTAKGPPRPAGPAVAADPKRGAPGRPAPGPVAPAPAVPVATTPAGFVPFADEPPGATVRDDVLRLHRSSFRALADATERLLSLLIAIDGPPDGATLAKKRAVEATIAELSAARAKLPRPNAAEEYRLLAEFAARLIDLGTRQKAEIARLLAKLPAGAFATEIRGQSGRIDAAIVALRRGMATGPAEVPCVDVILPEYADPDGLVGEAIRARLETMTDAAPPDVFRFRSSAAGAGGRVSTGIRLGPVADPRAFAATIRFGRVASVQGRKITVVDVHPDPADLAEVRAARARP